MADTLSAEDYQALYGLLTSSNDAERAQGQALSKKLTADEQQQFFDFQKTSTAGRGELQRTDNSVGGVPPEMAAAGLATIGGAVAGAGLSAAQRLASGAKAATGLAAPYVKYDLAKKGLHFVGVPEPFSTIGAMAIAGKGGAKSEAPAAAAEAPTAELSNLELARKEVAAGRLNPSILKAMEEAPAIRAERAAAMAKRAQSTPAPAPATAPEPAPPVARGPVMSEQMAKNQVGLVARRAGVRLAESDLKPLVEDVQAGTSPADAVAKFSAEHPEASTDPAAELARRLGTPSDAERTFPPNKSGLPTKSPTARKARGRIADLADMPK